MQTSSGICIPVMENHSNINEGNLMIATEISQESNQLDSVAHIENDIHESKEKKKKCGEKLQKENATHGI